MAVTVTPIKPEIGAEITGLSGHEFVDQRVAAECRAMLESRRLLHRTTLSGEEAVA